MIEGARTEALLVLADPALGALRDAIVAGCQRGLSISALLTGTGDLECGQVARHPRAESEAQELTDTLIVVADGREALIGSTDTDMTAAITRNHNLVLIARQFVWMELFAQRVYSRLGAKLLARLDPDDQRIFESYAASSD